MIIEVKNYLIWLWSRTGVTAPERERGRELYEVIPNIRIYNSKKENDHWSDKLLNSDSGQELGCYLWDSGRKLCVV